MAALQRRSLAVGLAPFAVGAALLLIGPALWAQAEPPLKPHEAYELARSRLLAQGWRPFPRRADDACAVVLPDDRRCARFPELASCAATGLGLCRFEWLSPDGRAYAVITRDGGPGGAPGRIESWFRLE
jgi:hypothetical protein